MTTPRYWGRRIRLAVGELVVERLRIAFDIEALAAAGSGVSTIRIWNLSPDNEQRIGDPGTPVKLEAGYGDGLSVIYDGAVTRMTQKRTGTDRITSLLVSTAVTSASPVVTQSWNGDTGAAAIAADIAQAMELELVGAQFLSGVMLHNYAVSAPAPRAMTLLLAKAARISGTPLSWRQQSGELLIFHAGASAQPVTREVSQAAGMVGSPELTDRGAEVAIVLDDVPKLGDTVRLTSSVVSGDWTVIGINYVGDNWQGEFLARLQLTRPGDNAGA